MSDEESNDSAANQEAKPNNDDAEYGDDYFAKYLEKELNKPESPPRFVVDDAKVAELLAQPTMRHKYQLDKGTNQWVLRNQFYPNEQPCHSRRYIKEDETVNKYTGREKGVRDGPRVEYNWNAAEQRWVDANGDPYKVRTKYTAADGTRLKWDTEKQGWLPNPNASTDTSEAEDEAEKEPPAEVNEEEAEIETPLIKYIDTVSSEYKAPNGTLYVLDKETNKWHATPDEKDAEPTDEQSSDFSDENMPDIQTADGTVYEWDRKTDEWKKKYVEPEVQPQSSEVQPQSSERIGADGTPYEWDAVRNGYFPKIDEDFIAMYQASYGFNDLQSNSTDSPASTSSMADSRSGASTSTSSTQEFSAEQSDTAGKNKKTQPAWFEEDPTRTTKVYVQNLPDDITEKDFCELMSKYGMILQDTRTKKLRVKLYAEPGGQLKGDALCTYIRPESVDMALNLLDGSDYRGRLLKVTRAKFEMRGDYNPALKPKRSKKDKQKQKKQLDKMLDWRPDRMRGEREKHENTIIFKNLFESDFFAKEVGLLLDYQDNLRDECSKYGRVKKVIVFSTEPEGIAKVVMDSPTDADTVIEMFNGRLYKGRVVSAETWDGRTKYKMQESEAETAERLAQWQQYLVTDDDKDK